MSELIVVEQLNAVEVFTGPQGVEKILADIEAKVRAFEPDTTTAKGRKEIAAMAYKVSQSKVLLDDLGKGLVADWKTKASLVDASRKTARDRLDVLRDSTRQPLTEWEEAEAARLAAEKLAKEIETAHEDALAQNDLFDRMKALAAREAELARLEAERLAAEEAARVEAERIAEEKRQSDLAAQREKDRQEAEVRRIKEAEERARKEAEEAAQRAILEAQRKEAEARAAQERAEREKIEAAERARIEQEQSVKAEQERARLAAEKLERDRLAKEAAEKAEAERLAADKEHRRKINREIIADVQKCGIDEATAKRLITETASGNIRNLLIRY